MDCTLTRPVHEMQKIRFDGLVESKEENRLREEEEQTERRMKENEKYIKQSMSSQEQDLLQRNSRFYECIRDFYCSSLRWALVIK